SELARLSNVHLDAQVGKEACPLNLAPTASTTATLALGDALAVALLDLRGFREEDFARSHPGGALGRKLLTHVRDVMRTGDAIPSVTANVPLSRALLEITRKGMAMTAIVDDAFRSAHDSSRQPCRRCRTDDGNLQHQPVAGFRRRRKAGRRAAHPRPDAR